jgi:excisionase family DNA binding protein
MMENFKTMTVKEFAKIIKVNTNRAYEIAKRPGFPSLRLGKRLVILRDGLDKWLESETQKEK